MAARRATAARTGKSSIKKRILDVQATQRPDDDQLNNQIRFRAQDYGGQQEACDSRGGDVGGRETNARCVQTPPRGSSSSSPPARQSIMLAIRRIRPTLARTARVSPTPPVAPRRTFNQWRAQPDAPQPVSAVRRILSLDFLKRWIVLSAGSFFVVGAFVATAYQGLQIYVEAFELGPERDPEVRRWQWDHEREDWGGDLERGGTDPRLGIWNQQLLRLAHIYEHQGRPQRKAEYREFSRGLLQLVIKNVSEKDPEAPTLPAIYQRLAANLERNDLRESLDEVIDCYERSLKATSNGSSDHARLRIRLGSVLERIGETSSARALWTEAAFAASQQETAAVQILVPAELPSAPFDQRTLCMALQNISSSLSSSGELAQAADLQRSARALLSPPTYPDIKSTSPPAALHSLYLAHRAALFSIHLAEVTYAQSKSTKPSLWSRSPPEHESPLALLQSAAEHSERVALALQGLEYSYIPPQSACDGPLQEGFVKNSRAMAENSTALLRDARRSAAQAWRLSGLVNRAQGDNVRALECFTRALAWVGPAEAAPDALASEWRTISTAYNETKEALLQADNGSAKKR